VYTPQQKRDYLLKLGYKAAGRGLKDPSGKYVIIKDAFRAETQIATKRKHYLEKVKPLGPRVGTHTLRSDMTPEQIESAKAYDRRKHVKKKTRQYLDSIQENFPQFLDEAEMLDYEDLKEFKKGLEGVGKSKKTFKISEINDPRLIEWINNKLRLNRLVKSAVSPEEYKSLKSALDLEASAEHLFSKKQFIEFQNEGSNVATMGKNLNARLGGSMTVRDIVEADRRMGLDVGPSQTQEYRRILNKLSEKLSKSGALSDELSETIRYFNRLPTVRKYKQPVIIEGTESGKPIINRAGNAVPGKAGVARNILNVLGSVGRKSTSGPVGILGALASFPFLMSTSPKAQAVGEAISAGTDPIGYGLFEGANQLWKHRSQMDPYMEEWKRRLGDPTWGGALRSG
jgi:hypothetical protein